MTRSEATGRRPRLAIVAMVGVIGVIAVAVMLGLGVLALSSQRPSSIAGFALDEEGAVHLVTVQCPGSGIGRVEIIDTGTRELVFTATLRAGEDPRRQLALDGSDDADYDKHLVRPFEAGRLYEARVLDDPSGNAIDFVQHRFHLGDLRAGQVLRGLTVDGNPDAQPADDFRTTEIRC